VKRAVTGWRPVRQSFASWYRKQWTARESLSAHKAPMPVGGYDGVTTLFSSARGPEIPFNKLKRSATNGNHPRQAATRRSLFAHSYGTRVAFGEKPLQIEWAGQGSNLRPWD
jgi:hypothetical protein